MNPSPIDLAKRLFAIHHHAETVFIENPDQIVYKESELIELLQQLGFPVPDWEEFYKSMEAFTAKLIVDNLISHPSDTIKECMEATGMTVLDLSKRLFIKDPTTDQRKYVEDLLAGKRHVTDALANSLEQIFKVDKQFWINSQKLYDRKLVEAAAKSRENPFKNHDNTTTTNLGTGMD